MTTFVLVPGACHGAWWFEPLARGLRHHGHEAHAVPLTGVGERRHMLSTSVNLDTHIEDVVNLLTDGDITEAVLVGHSYAGMVISGAADRVPERVAGLVFVDAFLPYDGESCWTLTSDEQRAWYVDGAAENGYATPPLPFFDPRSTPHPLASLLQRLKLQGGFDRFRRKEYVYATVWEGESPFKSSSERALGDPSWRTHPPRGLAPPSAAPKALVSQRRRQWRRQWRSDGSAKARVRRRRSVGSHVPRTGGRRPAHRAGPPESVADAEHFGVALGRVPLGRHGQRTDHRSATECRPRKPRNRCVHSELASMCTGAGRSVAQVLAPDGSRVRPAPVEVGLDARIATRRLVWAGSGSGWSCWSGTSWPRLLVRTIWGIAGRPGSRLGTHRKQVRIPAAEEVKPWS
ncbi:MAG TPA: alpha/beta fold hydrolase [Amycolatopsis sp.]|uniref:alpha/beta fold hydrolase n=1 Tax=Amycolatopsis sp. TaxID=37632 RepID=UPI002B49EFC5|nr:alpha/beta fold hydrolase [Amycolatopsis sp.]HKS45759.1 alpha/beta fold hydrolase [Amycolatopsis sp.]